MKHTKESLEDFYEMAHGRIKSMKSFQLESKQLSDERNNTRFMIEWMSDFINVCVYLQRYTECIENIKKMIEEAIYICNKYNTIPKPYLSQENELEFISLPTFQAGTLLGLKEQMIELAKIAEHGEVRPFYQQPICWYACFFRYYYQEDTQKRDQAIHDLLLVKRPRYGTSLGAYEFPPKAMSEALTAIFEKNDEAFNFFMKKILKWHERAADKKLTKTGNTVISMLLSLPAAAAMQLARDHGINVKVKSEAVPEEIFQLRNYLT